MRDTPDNLSISIAFFSSRKTRKRLETIENQCAAGGPIPKENPEREDGQCAADRLQNRDLISNI